MIFKESTWTPPLPRCPHPEWWHAPDSDSTETEVSYLIGGLIQALQPEIVVETGTAFGYTALEIVRAIHKNGHGKLYTLEPDDARRSTAYNLVRSVFSHPKPLDKYVEFIHIKSLEWNPPGIIDFAFFDSLLELRVDEFLRYKYKMRKGTIVAFHDSAAVDKKYHYDVRGNVERQLVQKGFIRVIELPTPRGLILGEVIK